MQNPDDRARRVVGDEDVRAVSESIASTSATCAQSGSQLAGREPGGAKSHS